MVQEINYSQVNVLFVHNTGTSSQHLISNILYLIILILLDGLPRFSIATSFRNHTNLSMFASSAKQVLSTFSATTSLTTTNSFMKVHHTMLFVPFHINSI